MSFSRSAWQSVEPWFAAIMRHPFVVALADGTLGEDVFARYLLDDAHYLKGFAQALAALAAKAAAPEATAVLAQAGANAIAAERLLHRSYLVPRGIDPDGAGVTEASPTCRAYTGTLLASAAFAPLEVGLAGLLPCFRVYAEVGRALLATAPSPDHPYREWIATYADPEFDQAVVAVEAIADALAVASSSQRVAEMLTAYQLATRFEWMFWDAAWRGECWPDSVSLETRD